MIIEKIKGMLFWFIIFCSIILSCLAINTYLKSTSTLELSDTSENKEKIKELRKKLSLLEQNDCTKEISRYIERYENTSFDGYATFGEIENNDFMLTGSNNCSTIKEFISKNSPLIVFRLAYLRDVFLEEYKLQYELQLDIFSSSDIYLPSTEIIEYRGIKTLELLLIERLIEMEGEAQNNEVVVEE